MKNLHKIGKELYITSDEELVLDGYHFNSKYGDEPQKTNQRDIDSRKYWEEEDYYITKIVLTTDQDLIADGIQAINDEFLEWFVKNPSCERVEVKSEILYEHKDTYRPYPSECKNLTKTKVNYYLSIIPKEEPKQEDCSCTDECLGYLTKTCKRIEEPKQETLEEVAEKYANDWEEIHPKLNFDAMTPIAISKIDFIEGAKWQQERSYSEEEVLNFTQTIIQQYKFGNTNIEQLGLLKETLQTFKNK